MKVVFPSTLLIIDCCKFSDSNQVVLAEYIVDDRVIFWFNNNPLVKNH